MKYLYGTAVMAAVLAGAQAQEESALVSTALEFLARASSTSEVLTLNLTNLLILLVLKAIIFGFGLFSVGGTARSDEGSQSSSISEADLTGGMCFMMYMAGDDDKLFCIQKAACQDPKTAAEYATAGKMVYKAHQVFNMPVGPKYQIALDAVQDAKDQGLRGDCSAYKW